MASLAGDDDNPAVPGFDPDVSAELYTTNGDVTDDAYNTFGTLAYTVELDGGTGAGGRRHGRQRSQRLHAWRLRLPGQRGGHRGRVEEELRLRARPGPLGRTIRRTSSRTWATPRRELVPTTFPISYGDPQTVEVNAKRELGAVTLHWKVNGGREHTASTQRVPAAARATASPGVYYHVPARRGDGHLPGRQGRGVVHRRKASSDPFTYDARTSPTTRC